MMNILSSPGVVRSNIVEVEGLCCASIATVTLVTPFVTVDTAAFTFKSKQIFAVKFSSETCNIPKYKIKIDLQSHHSFLNVESLFNKKVIYD